MFRLSLAVAIFVVVGCVASPAVLDQAESSGARAPSAPLVSTEEGAVSGSIADGIYSFKGVPFAAPPIGGLRWQAPKPPSRHAKTVDGSKYGPACPQLQLEGDDLESPVIPNQDEDCLTLNIWTSSLDAVAKKPVMVFLHGGWGVRGTGSLPVYSGAALARDGVVLVTINYRLGPFGYLAHPALSREAQSLIGHKTSGNYALLDQIQALRWIQRNAAAFGGDPGNVTIYGQSNGAVSTQILLASPLSKGLFQRAIVMSGWFRSQRMPLPESEKLGIKIAQKLDCVEERSALQCMRSKSAAEVIKAVGKAGTFGAGAHFQANRDGYVLPTDVAVAFRSGAWAKVPVVFGMTRNETLRYARSMGFRTVAGYEAFLKRTWPRWAARLQQQYPAKSNADVVEALSTLFDDKDHTCADREAAAIAAQQGISAYLYRFDFVTKKAREKGLGAYHGIELPYVFGTIADKGDHPYFQREQAVSKSILHYWSSFAAYGDPNGAPNPNWPRFSDAKMTAMSLSDVSAPVDSFGSDRCKIWDEIAR